jgi:cation transport ATPase
LTQGAFSVTANCTCLRCRRDSRLHPCGCPTLRKIKQNFLFAFFYNVLAILIAAAGLLQPWMAAAAMGMSDICVIGNALLLYRWKFGRR